MTHPSVGGAVFFPDVVELPFHHARDVAAQAGVTLANSDPDGSPIGALAWPGFFVVTAQHIAPGTAARCWDSLPIEIAEDRRADRGALAEPITPPPALVAHAEPEEHLVVVDLDDGDGPIA